MRRASEKQRRVGSFDGNDSDYESAVATTIRTLKLFPHAVIRRNVRLRGVKQPGSYEIDILARFRLQQQLSFTVIIECKQWRRRVDRPVVQKLIQTRDALAAQKAVIVSPVGFTGEAVAVAEANGVALWVVGRRRFVVIKAMRLGLPSLDISIYNMLTQRLRSLLLPQLAKQVNANSLELLPYDAVDTSSDGRRRRPFNATVHEDDTSLLDELVTTLYRAHMHSPASSPGGLGAIFDRWNSYSKRLLKRWCIDPNRLAEVLLAAASFDFESFCACSKLPDDAIFVDSRALKRAAEAL